MSFFRELLEHLTRTGARGRRYLFSFEGWRTRLVFWGGAIAVGAAAALFARFAEYAMHGFQWLTQTSGWLTLIVTPSGLVLAVWLTRRLFKGTEGSGIPQTIAAIGNYGRQQRKRLLSLRVAIGKILLTGLGLASGASIGREGPSVQVGASILYRAGKLARFPQHEMERGLVLAGGAAGIAAAFNTPLAGVIFAIEEMSRSFEERTTGSMLIAVIIAGMTALAINGNYTYFGTARVEIKAIDWMIVPLCGIAGGLLGGVFSSALVAGSGRLAPVISAHPYRVALACGLTVAVVGVISGNVIHGTGYRETAGILSNTAEPNMLYPLFKMLATLASYLSGIPGGIFAPSLSVGAGLGADLAPLFPNVPIAALAILGMVSYFAGVVQTPITAFVIVMEITGSHTMALPLMATSFIAYGASRLVCREPIYRALARRFVETDAGMQPKRPPVQAEPKPTPSQTTGPDQQKP